MTDHRIAWTPPPSRSKPGPIGGTTGPEVMVDAFGLSDRGRRREDNEDHFLIARLDRMWHRLHTNLDDEAMPAEATDTVYGMAVADGMGGHAAGEVASRIAITALVDILLRTPNLITRLNREMGAEVLNRLARRFEAVKNALVDAVEHDATLRGMGTTMTVTASFKAYLVVGHVGDSRAYLNRRGTLERLTRDQTMAQFLRDTGVFTDEELATHPLRHTLTGVLGTSGTEIDADMRVLRLEDGDDVLLCTDGLTEMVSESAIAEVLASPPASAESVCRRLVQQALDEGGKDNVTVALSRYRIADV
jgi:serine/threonine protein phosphatase PrpC